MSEIPAAPAVPAAAVPPITVTAVSSPPPSHEGLVERMGDWFRQDAEPVLEKAIPAAIKAALTEHSGLVFDLAADVVRSADPEVAALLPQVLKLAASVAQVAAAAL